MAKEEWETVKNNTQKRISGYLKKELPEGWSISTQTGDRRHSPKDEVTVVLPKRLKRWREYTPEPIIQRLIEHKMWVREQLEKDKGKWITLPEFEYKLPPLPIIREKPEVYARATDCDGVLEVRMRYAVKVDKRYKYYRPRIRFISTTYELTEDYARAIRSGNIRPRAPRPPKTMKVTYTVSADGSRCIHAVYLMNPYFIKWKEEANQILTIYREHPEIPRD